jgi:hypothetical protein
MVAPIREELAGAGLPLLDAKTVADAVIRAAGEGESGTCWVVQPGREPAPYAFRGVPGAVREDRTVPPPASVR